MFAFDTPLSMVGSPAPWLKAPVLGGNPNFVFDTIAGRPVLMLFYGTMQHDVSRSAVEYSLKHAPLFDDVKACFFGVSNDPIDAERGLIASRIPGIRFILDYQGAVSRAFHLSPKNENRLHPHFIVLDQQLRVAGIFGLEEAPAAFACLTALIDQRRDDQWAPVVEVPRIFEPELCAALIAHYEATGGEDSGFMREVDGKTVAMVNHDHKKRSDALIDNPDMQRALNMRIFHRLRPALQRSFQFDATRIERYIVACYDAETGGHFRPHRDNTTKGTAHRRFAVTINLNADDYEGGDLVFPEFGARGYRAPTGGAIVFSCSLLHEVKPIISGRRFAFLPFLYDDAASAIRVENNAHLGDGVAAYRE